MEKYDKERGLIKNYQEIIPGPISQTTAELIEQIKTKTTSETLALFSKNGINIRMVMQVNAWLFI